MKLSANPVLFMFIIFILISPMCITAESTRSDDVVTFSKLYGGRDSDFPNSLIETTDGCYVVVGDARSNSAGYTDICLIKIDGHGNEIWNRRYGGENIESGWSCRQTSDNGFIILGEKSGVSGFWLIKTDMNGIEEWNNTYGWDGEGYDVVETRDGGYVIVGFIFSRKTDGTQVRLGLLIKTDNKGDEIWAKKFGQDYHNILRSVLVTNDGGYIIGGYTYSYGARFIDAWLIKTDASGNEIWNKTYGGWSYDYASSISKTNDGGYVIIGYTESYGAGSKDAWLIKTDASGNEIWSKTYGGSNHDRGYSIQNLSDGGYIIVGFTYSYGDGERDIWLIAVDSNGNEQWNLTYGGQYSDWARSVLETSDNGYLIAGSTSSYSIGQNNGYKESIWLLKTDSKGKIVGGEVPSSGDTENGEKLPNGDESGGGDSPSKFHWLWIAIGAGAVILIVIIIIIIRRRNDDEWDDEDDEDYDGEDLDESVDSSVLPGRYPASEEEEEIVRRKTSKRVQRRCVKCTAVLVSPNAVFCTACGSSQVTVSAPVPTPQSMNCPGCGGVKPQGTAFCGMCGMNLQQSLGGAPTVPMVQQVPVMQQPVSNQFVQPAQAPASNQFVRQPPTQAPVQPMAQQGYVQQRPVSGQFVQQPQTQAPAQPMAQQGYGQQQPIPGSASMFPQQQQQNPPAPPPPAPPGYGGLQ